MNLINTIPSFLELICVIILWSKFNKGGNCLVVKNISVIVLCFLITFFSKSCPPLLFMVINYTSLVISLSYINKCNFMETIFKTLVICSVLIFIQFIFFIVLNFLKFYKESVYTGIIVNYILACISTLVYYNKYSDRIFNHINLYIKNINLILRKLSIINLIIIFVIFKTIWDYFPRVVFINKIYIFLIIAFAYIFNFYLCKYSITLYEKNKVEEMHYKYLPMITTIVEDVRAKQHDFKNHINTIYGIVQVSQAENLKSDLENYLLSLNQSLGKFEIFKTKSNIINSIIYSKLCEAEKNNVIFKYTVNDVIQLPILEYEISEILSNLLNNAFEMVYNQNNNFRYVELSINNLEKEFIIIVKNTVVDFDAKNLNKIFKRGYSTKGSARGYGLHNVKTIVSQNNGKVFVNLEDDIIVFQIILKK